jgi:ABC-type glycerol-3-phosphate transport system substrate-binding protein
MLQATAATAADKVIRMYAGGDNIDYTPTRSQERNEANPYPRNRIRLLADAWERTHPGFRIEFVSAPSSDLNYRAWCISNFIGGTIPHIVYQNMGNFRDSDFNKGWVLRMDPYLDRPNPYVAGNLHWRDLFYTPWVDALRSIDGGCYWIAPDTIGVGIVCNLKILGDCGITTPPTTLSEFAACCERIRKAGYIAYFPIEEWYVNCVMPSVIWSRQIPEMDADHNGIVNQQEMTHAITVGLFKADSPQMLEYLRLYQKLSHFYPRGWNIMEPLYVFKQGRVAFMEATSAHMKRLQDDERLSFKTRVLPFPDITAADSPFGGAPLAGSGNSGYTSTWQITSAAQHDGLTDLCVDWLMFLTTPQHSAEFVNELGFMLPGVKGAEPIPQFKSLMNKAMHEMSKPGYLDWHAFNPLVNYSNELNDNWSRIRQSVALDTIDLSEAARRVDFWLMRAHRTMVRRQTQVAAAAATPHTD